MSLHVLDQLVQGSTEWHDARRGLITASVVGKLLTNDQPDATTVQCPSCNVGAGPCLSLATKKPTLLKAAHSARLSVAAEMLPVLKVADNDTSRAVTYTLAAERLAGFTEDTPMNSDMWRGVDSEPYARDVYSGHYQQAVEVGFMRRDEDDWSLGYSPDGLVADDGLIEIKAPRAKTHLRTILTNEVPTYYMAQVQAGLLVSGRKWLDWISYCGGMPLFVKRVLPDPIWHEAIVAACRKFETDVAQIVTDYEAASKGLPATERIQELEMSL